MADFEVDPNADALEVRPRFCRYWSSRGAKATFWILGTRGVLLGRSYSDLPRSQDVCRNGSTAQLAPSFATNAIDSTSLFGVVTRAYSPPDQRAG